ncbi:MAG: MBOAT family protein, partial [Betaproteobacteria bacterium]|nr:MBOAT family protein [Betaproteobacteria bacterium]
MLFNSYQFILLFLPALLIAYWLVSQVARDRLGLLLFASSLIFYSLWGMEFLILLLCITGLNCAFGQVLAAMPDQGEGGVSRKQVLTLALVINMAPLCWFKYVNFFIDNINMAFDASLAHQSAGLPLGISFYTFLQIAYLVTVYRRQTEPAGLLQYANFATFFPYVISGPIVRYPQFGPQLANPQPLTVANIAQAMTFFVIGLAKKVLLADSIAAYANSIFNAAHKGFPLTSAEAWVGSLAYTFQLYFDFSGYTDMAVGVALFFGLHLPDNFDSPYKSTGIVDFWRRWHITLSLWLRDFLYIPLGGSRVGKFKQYRNLLLTMLIGGLWHGAGWTFIIWGGMHGVMLCVNHFWKTWAIRNISEKVLHNYVLRVLSIGFTFLCINLAWVIFRVDSLHAAGVMYSSMAGIFSSDFSGGWSTLFANNYLRDAWPVIYLAVSCLLVWCFPTTRQIINGMC